MNKEIYFLNKIKEFSLKFKIQKPYLAKDNRIKAIGTIYKGHYITSGKKGHMLKYSAKNLQQLSKIEIIHSTLHELGHIKYDGSTHIIREYKAEKFALMMMKKYYSDWYYGAIRCISRFVNNQNLLYGIAYKKLLTDLSKQDKKVLKWLK